MFFTKPILTFLEKLNIYVSTVNVAEGNFIESQRLNHIKYFYKNWVKHLYLEHQLDEHIKEFIDFCLVNDLFSYSQVQQDLWVLFMCNLKREGFFVEFGAADGYEHSNTLSLEKYFGWKGILVEPVPHYFKKLIKRRTAKAYQGCIAINNDPVCNLVVPEYGQFSSIHGFHNLDMHTEARKTNRQIQVKTYELNDLLEQNSPPNGVVDYLSIDVEGAERAVLERIDFNRWDFKYVTVEHNCRKSDMQFLEEFFLKKGYRRFCTDRFAENEYWFWK